MYNGDHEPARLRRVDIRERCRVAWTAMGEGTIDQRAFFTRFRDLCRTCRCTSRRSRASTASCRICKPDSGRRGRIAAPALADSKPSRAVGHAVGSLAGALTGADKRKAEQDYQRAELDAVDLLYCRKRADAGRQMKCRLTHRRD